MTTRNGLILTAGFLLVACCGITGCKDGTAARRVEVQNAIIEATHALETGSRYADSSDPEQLATVRSKLQSVVTQISSIDDSAASDGQKSAKALLSAAALRRLAVVNLTEAETIEAEVRGDRAVVQSQINAAMRLDSIATGRASVDTGEQQVQLARDKATARARLQTYDAQLAELSEPISSLSDQNEAYQARLVELRSQADKLYREAAELGPNQGFPSYQLAVETRSDADQIEARMALNEINLDYDFQAEHNLASARATQLQQMITSIEDSEASLQNMAREGDSEVGATRQTIQGFAGQIDQTLTRINQRTTDDLDGLYDEALSQLDRAAGQANRAARGDSADMARLAAARAEALTGRTALSRAQSTSEHVNILEQIVAAEGVLGDGTSYAAELATARAKHTEAIEQATSAYHKAEETLRQVSSRAGAEVQAFAASVQEMLAVLEGRPKPETAAPVDDTAAAPDDSSARGFPTPQALLAHFKQAAANGGAADGVTDVMHAETPAGRMLIEFQKKAQAMGARLQRAMESSFGSAAGLQQGSTLGAMPFDDAEVVGQGSGRASIESASQPDGMGLALVQVGDAWFIDADTLAASPAMQQAMDPKVMQAMDGLFDALAERVENGEFATQDEVMAAMMAEIMQRMGQGGGG